jgi:hypothetical protein
MLVYRRTHLGAAMSGVSCAGPSGSVGNPALEAECRMRALPFVALDMVR